MKKNKMFGLGVGTTSVLMIFIVLCLTILGTLLYMITKSDMTITEKKANYSVKYQMAENVAVETLSSIDECLYELTYNRIKFGDSRECSDVLSKIKNVFIDYDNKTILYKVGLSDNMYFDVKLRVNTNTDGYVLKKNSYTIIKWKIDSKDLDLNKDNLNVWK